jgi:hypothetical protein
VRALLDNSGAQALHPGDTFYSFIVSATLTITSVDLATGTVGFSIDHQYLDDGPSPGNGTTSDTYTISVSVSDDSNASDSTSRQAVIENIAPTVVLDPVQGIQENGVATVTGTFTDAGLYDAHTLTVNWGDPNNGSPATFSLPGFYPYGYPYLYAGASLYSTTDSAILTITSVDSTTGQIGFQVQRQYLGDGLAPGNATDSDISVISVTVTDDDGGSGSASRFLTVSNAAPTVSLNTLQGIQPPQTLVLNGGYTDIGLLDAHTLTVEWGDSTVSTFAIPATQTAGGATTLGVGDSFSSSTDSAALSITFVLSTTGDVYYSVQHPYAAPGEVTVKVTVADHDAGSGSDSVTLSVQSLVVVFV